MSEQEYAEPTTEQLARFLVVYIPSTAGLDLSPDVNVVRHLLETNDILRQHALRHHRKFQDQIKELDQKMKAGQLPCQFIRPNGKQCPNYNQPGSYYCGLHIDSEEP